MAPNFPFLSPEARGPWSEDRVAAAEVPWSERMKKIFFFNLLAPSEGTWYCLSSGKTPVDMKANIFFSIYLPLVKGLDIVYLQERPPWMRMQKEKKISIY